ncbi:MAG: metallophosphoesterase [Clostridiales bacterium]|nr:metallophosphoesterase [Clostridiales bacterium]
MKKTFRSFLSILLCFALLLPFIGATAQSEQPLSVWVAADLHYQPHSSIGPIEEQSFLPGDPLYAHVNDKGMLIYESDAILHEFLSRFEESSAKYLLIPGDISLDGHWDEHLGIAAILNEFKQRTGKKIFVIPGNHDIRTSESGGRLDLADFISVYRDLGYSDALVAHDTSGSYTAELDNEYRLLAWDACIYRKDGSQVTPELLAWIEVQVNQAKIDGKKLIGMVHHSVLEHFGIQSLAGNMLCLENYRENANKFADWGIKVFFTGHGHANDISMAVSANGNRIYDIETGCLMTYPNAYREVSFSNSAVDVKTHYVDTIDISYLPPGYNQAQLDLIQRDFPTYSYNYFTASIIRAAYDLPQNASKFARKLKIEEGTPAYEALATMLDTLADALKLPLYDTAGTPEVDSVEEIAAKAGVTLQQSDYRNMLEIFGVIYAEHYAGDENLPYDSAEVTLFRQSFNAVIVFALTNMPISVANTLFVSLGLPASGFHLADKIYTPFAKRIYMETAAKLVFVEVMKPLLNSFTTDNYAPGDLNETLEPYGVNWDLTGTTVRITDAGYIFDIIFKLFGIVINAIKAVSAT